MRRTLLILPLLLLAGCTTKSAQESEAVPGRSKAAAEADVLRVALLAEPTSLDPAKITDIYTSDAVSHAYESLVRFNEKNELEPCLAEKWDVSKDGLTYTFHLRKGVKFHTGQTLTAADVKYSWERALAPKLASTVAENYLDGVVGVKEVHAGQRTDLPGVEVVDDLTLRVKIDRPRAYFLGMMAYISNSVICREAVLKNDGKVDDKIAPGTGPFMVEAYQPGTQVSFKAFDAYWGGRPKVSRVLYPIIINQDTAYSKFQTNGLDVMEGNRLRYANDKEANVLGNAWRTVPSASVTYLVMHTVKQPLFKKLEVRKAFAMAIDREQILKVGFKGLGQVANGFLPRELPDIGPDPAPIPYDPAKAKALLAQAGFLEGKGFPSLVLSVLEKDVERIAAAQIVAANLRDNLGITVSIQERENGQLLSDAENQKLEFYFIGWFADYLDPQNFLSTLLTSYSSINRVKYHNPQFDALCLKADAESNHAERAKLYGEANRILMDEVGVLPIVFSPRVFLVQPNVRGWRANLSNPLPNTVTTK